MSLRARGIWVGAVAVLFVFLAIPSFFSEQERLQSDLIPDSGINLGLDLQGGIHWLLRIDTDTAVKQEMARTKGVLEELFEERDVAFSGLELDEQNELVLRGADAAVVQPLVDQELGSIDVTPDGDALRLTLSREWHDEVVSRGVRQSLEVLRTRIDDLGVREPIIAPQGDDRILVQMPGDIDPKTASEMISRTTFLEFKKVLNAAPSVELLEAQYADGLPEDTQIVTAKTDDLVSEALLVPATPILTGAMLEDARVAFDRRNRAIVSFTWNSEGTRIFREFTAENIGERLGAIIDGNVVTAPVIQSRIGRSGQIEGRFTQEEAARLAVALRSGALPIPLVIEEERTVGPSLGADSIRQGVRSILVGGTLVILFMVVYYKVSGVLANLALILNILIIIGAMGSVSATLTLPGIAGLVLTVGMAVDANVIIFERIREELRRGAPIRAAVSEGFGRSLYTIVDANVTTMIAAVVLLYYGRGPVQGFGVTLAIGIASSVFCALVVTRLLVELALSRRPTLSI